MAVNYLLINSSGDTPTWNTNLFPGAAGMTHILVIDASTDVPTWATIHAGPGENDLTIESSTDVLSWS